MSDENTKEIKILIVDDEEDMLIAVKTLLSKYHYNIYTAKNGKEALSILEKQDIDCVLSDIKMPLMDGISLIKNVRQNNNHVPFIFFTGFGSDESMKEALKYGAFDFIQKPLFDDLESIVKKGVESNFKRNNDQFLENELFSEYHKLLNDKP